MADIDVDCQSFTDIRGLFPEAIRASVVKAEQLTPHQAGIYFQAIPEDPITGLSAIPYQHAEEFGYFKFDLLSLTLLDQLKSKAQLRDLLKKEPDWSMLEDEKIVEKLFQIGKHFNIIKYIKPKSVQELADVIAIIRPTKKHLLAEYLIDPEKVREELYKKEEGDKVSFRKAHSISYALTIIVQLHLLKESSNENDLIY